MAQDGPYTQPHRPPQELCGRHRDYSRPIEQQSTEPLSRGVIKNNGHQVGGDIIVNSRYKLAKTGTKEKQDSFHPP